MENNVPFMFRLLLLIIGIAHVAGEDDVLTEVYKDMGIIPNYLDKPPDGYLKIVYDQNVVVKNGMELKPSQTKDPPAIEWTTALRTYFTIIMVCPDVPSRKDPYLREWLHWLVVNIPETDIEQGDAICPHIPLLAPKDMGLLRYVYFVFQQTEYMLFDEPRRNNTSAQGHDHFDTIQFVKKYKLGYPIASATFQGQWEEFVDSMFEKMHIVKYYNN